MKKILIAGILTVWLTALLCGCAGAAQAESGGTPEKLAEDTGVILLRGEEPEAHQDRLGVPALRLFGGGAV